MNACQARRITLIAASMMALTSAGLAGCGDSSALPAQAREFDGMPAPCARVHAPLATTLRADDDAEGERLGTARKDAREAAYPDRPLNPNASTDIPKVAEGWRYRWPQLTGNRMQFVFFLSRDNALLSATAFAPDPVRCPGRRPLIVIGSGSGVDAEVRKWWAGQALAEAGYVALTFDYLNQGFSEATGHTEPDGTGNPIPPGCGDTDCPRGEDDRLGGVLDAQDAIHFALSTPAAPYRGGFEGQDGDSVFPFHQQVHPEWIGFAGHSRGAKVASVLPGQEPRLGAVVAWTICPAICRATPAAPPATASMAAGWDFPPITFRRTRACRRWARPAPTTSSAAIRN